VSPPGRLRKRPQVFQTRAYFWTFFFIFGNQQTRSSDRSATPLRPFLRCRDLGIDRWPHRKLQSLSNLYVDLKAHMDRCEKDSAKRHHYCNDMAVIKAYSIRLESDLSLLNQFYNGKKAWPDQILKIRQTIYKKRHAKVLSEKKKKLSHAGKQCQKGELPVVKCEASDSEVDVKQETNDSEDFSVDTKDSDDSLCVAMPECINDGALMMRSLESEGAHMVGDKDDNMFWAML